MGVRDCAGVGGATLWTERLELVPSVVRPPPAGGTGAGVWPRPRGGRARPAAGAAGGGGGSPIASTIPVALALCPGQRRAAHWCKYTRLLGAGARRPAHGFMRSACAWASLVAKWIGPFRLKNDCQLCQWIVNFANPVVLPADTCGQRRESCCIRVARKRHGQHCRLFVPCDPAGAGCLLAWSCFSCGQLCPPRRRPSCHFLEMGLTVWEGGHGARRFRDAELPVRAAIRNAGLTARAARFFCVLCVAGWTPRTSARASIRSAWA